MLTLFGGPPSGAESRALHAPGRSASLEYQNRGFYVKKTGGWPDSPAPKTWFFRQLGRGDPHIFSYMVSRQLTELASFWLGLRPVLE
jgi:hypothetical protein